MESTPSPNNLIKPSLLIVVNDEDLCTLLNGAFSEDYAIVHVRDRKEALDVLGRDNLRVMLLDLSFPPFSDYATEGFKALEEIATTYPCVKIITISQGAERKDAVRAISLGAYDHFPKPIHAEDLKIVVHRAFVVSDLESGSHGSQKQPVKGSEHANLIGHSQAMQDVFLQIDKVSPTDVSVLITGESGTGKELVARAIHEASPRMDAPFVAINCAAIPENLLESELFGYEKGAFTGAYETKKGRLEYAHTGTLFLDEIGELSQVLQAKLLRFLQERTIQRIGGKKDILLEVRVICATNQDLLSAIDSGKFREDLYYRITVFHIALPALRERGEDVILIAKAFLSREVAHFRKKNQIRGFSRETYDALTSHPWPGNIRELGNRIKRAVLMANGPLVGAEEMGLTPQHPALDKPAGLKEAKEQLEKDMIAAALRKSGGRIGLAATDLGISRQFLNDLVKKHQFYEYKKLLKVSR